MARTVAVSISTSYSHQARKQPAILQPYIRIWKYLDAMGGLSELLAT